jgi:HEAT repeat protein
LCYCGKGRGTLEGIDLEKAMQLGAQIDGGQAMESASPGEATVNSTEVVMALRAALRETELNDMDPTIRALAGKANAELASQAPSQVPALLEALRNDDQAVRFGAANSLSDLGAAARSALGPLTQALQDRDLGVRVQAARALWRIDQQAAPAIPVLVEALRSDDEILRWIAADCLGELGPRASVAIPALQESLRQEFQIAHVRAGFTLALERIGAGRASEEKGLPGNR